MGFTASCEIKHLFYQFKLNLFSLMWLYIVKMYLFFFRYSNVLQKLNMKLPVTINKFFEPTVMNSEAFFTRWKNLNKYVSHSQNLLHLYLQSVIVNSYFFVSSPSQEAQKIFKAKYPMDTEATKAKVGVNSFVLCIYIYSFLKIVSSVVGLHVNFKNPFVSID